MSLPRIEGRALRGVAADADGFIPIDERCRVVGMGEHVFAAGDADDFPVKQGGLGAQQADVAAAGIAALAGEREPTASSRCSAASLITGERRRLYFQARLEDGHAVDSEVLDAPAWEADEKIVAEELGRTCARSTPELDAEQAASRASSPRRPPRRQAPSDGRPARRLGQELDDDQRQHRPGREGERDRKQAGDLLDREVGDHGANGLRRAREHGRAELLGAPEAGRLHRDRDARALRDVLERDREEHEQGEPLVSDANAAPIAKPSGRLCTSRTAKTSSERRTPGAAQAGHVWIPGESRRRRPAGTRSRARPPAASAREPSSSAGSSSPATDATPISPMASPHSRGAASRRASEQEDRHGPEAGGQRGGRAGEHEHADVHGRR